MPNMKNVIHLFLLLLSTTLVCTEGCSGDVTIWLYKNGDCQREDECLHLANCTTWHGSLLIKTSLEKTGTTSAPHFPRLREITGYLVIAIYELGSFTMMPELSVIRGNSLIGNYAFVVYSTGIKELYLPSLTTILKGGVRIARNRKLCYINTVRWKSIVKDKEQTGKYGIVLESNNANCDTACAKGHCYTAPGHDSNPNAQYCWGPGLKSKGYECQRFCSTACVLAGCTDGSETQCCDAACLGGCTQANSALDCHACRHYRIKSTGKCVEKCPEKHYLVDNIFCDVECPGWSDPSSRVTYYSLEGRCVTDCPAYYEIDLAKRLCVKCLDTNQCSRVCKMETEDIYGKEYEGAIIRVPADVFNKGLAGCTEIIGSITFQLQEGTGSFTQAVKALRSLKVVKGHIQIQKSAFKTLDFLSNLELIDPPPDKLLFNKYAIAVHEDNQLSQLWNTSSLTVTRGDLFFRSNARLCPRVITDLQKKMKTENGGKVKGDISKTDNGYRVVCEVDRLKMEAREIQLNLFKLFMNDTDSDPSLHVPMQCIVEKCVEVFWNFTRDSGKIVFYSIYYQEMEMGADALIHAQDECENINEWKMISVERPTEEVFKQVIPMRKVITDLQPYKKYAFFIKEVLAKGEARTSIIHYVDISQSKPSPPENFEASFLSEDKIQLRWAVPAQPNGRIVAYKIYYEKASYSFWQEQQALDWCTRDVATETRFPAKTKPVVEKNVCQTNVTCDCDKKTKKKKTDLDYHRHVIEFHNRVNEKIFRKEVKDGKEKNNDKSEEDSGLMEDFEKFFGKVGGTEEEGEPSTTPNALLNNNDTSETFKDIFSGIDFSDNKLEETFESDKETSIVQVAGDVFTYVIPDLEYFQDYLITVCACTDEANQGSCANPDTDLSIECGTTQARTGINITADNLPPDSVSVSVFTNRWNMSWTPPARPNAVVLKYEISIRHNISDDDILYCHPASLPNHFTRSSALTGDFYAKMRVISPAGNGSWSEVVHFNIEAGDDKTPDNRVMVAVITAVSLLLLVLLAFAIYYALFYRNVDKSSPGVLYASVNPEYMNAKEVYMPDEWELNREKIELIRELGQGSFGMVFEGIAHDLSGQTELRVAVKTTNENASIHDRIEFLQEASIMKAFNCNHVVKLIGVVSQGQPTFVVMELMGRGDLKSFLKSRRPEEQSHLSPPSQKEVYQMVAEIADGMAYLAARKFVHRDLAARNCMVALDFTCKIGDFGMTRDIYETDYYRKGGKGLLPVRWMSPESLKDGIFTTASDVWSFGVVLWEICTLAQQPYQGKSNEQVLNFVIEGGHLDTPPHCDKQMQEFMSLCWLRDHKLRPSFLEVVRLLEEETNEEFVVRSFYHEMKRKALEDNLYDLFTPANNNKRDKHASQDSGTFPALDEPEVPAQEPELADLTLEQPPNYSDREPMLRVDSLYDNCTEDGGQMGDTPLARSNEGGGTRLNLSEIFYSKPVPV